jgi:predicted MFS family arabinose efflux permease
MGKEAHIFTKSFFLLNVIYFLIFSNLAIFFNFYSYLKTLSIAPEWFGFLIGLDALISLILRPFISPFFTAKNAPRTILWSTGLVFLALLGYTVTRELVPMLLVRSLHGVSFVIVSSALTAYTVSFIPPSRSAQAFGVISVSFLLPYAVIPYAVEWILVSFKSYEATFLFAALLVIPVFPVLLFMNKSSTPSEATEVGQRGRLVFKDVVTNLKNKRIAALLVISIVTFVAFSILYYFLKSFAIHIGAKDIGYFFTIYALTMICMRLTVGHLFDKTNKYVLLFMSLIFTGLCYIFAGKTDSILMLYLLAFFFGIGIGAIVPLINGIAFDISDPQMRGLNLNLIIETRDLGFFIGPILATPILNKYGYAVLYYFCGIVSMLSVILIPMLAKQKHTQ